MKALIKKMKALWRYLFPTKIERINKKLGNVTYTAVKERKLLKKAIENFVKKKFGFKMGSRYMPIKGYNQALIYEAIHQEYGVLMREKNVAISRALVWK